MIKGIESIMVGSGNARRLAQFYTDVVGLKSAQIGSADDGTGYFGFELETGSFLVIADHSKVTGKNVNPERFILNFVVDDIDLHIKKLDNLRVHKIREKYTIDGYGQIVTYKDLDGNFFQFVEIMGEN